MCIRDRYLAMVLKKAGHDAHLLYSRDSKNNKTRESLEKIDLGVGVMNLKEAYEYKFDVVIQLGLAIEIIDAKKFKESKIELSENGNHQFKNFEDKIEQIFDFLL